MDPDTGTSHIGREAMKRAIVLLAALALAAPMSAIAGERPGNSTSQGSLPFSPVARDPQSTRYQPFFGIESDRRTQREAPSNCNQYESGRDRGYRGNGGQGRHGGGSGKRR